MGSRRRASRESRWKYRYFARTVQRSAGGSSLSPGACFALGSAPLDTRQRLRLHAAWCPMTQSRISASLDPSPALKAARPSLLDRLLGIVTEVRAGEGLTA